LPFVTPVVRAAGKANYFAPRVRVASQVSFDVPSGVDGLSIKK
jgi:hypothetical protein